MAREPQLISKRSYDDEINAIMTLFTKHDRNSIVTYMEMEEAIGLNRKDSHNIWSYIITKLKKRLLDTRGVALRSVRNVGYRLLTANEQLLDQKHEESAAKRIRQGCTEKALIRQEELTEHERAIQLALVHHAHKAGELLRIQAAERKGFLASHESVNQYNRINSLRPQARISSQE